MGLFVRLHDIIYVKFQLLSIVIAINIKNKETRVNEALWPYINTIEIDFFIKLFILALEYSYFNHP